MGGTSIDEAPGQLPHDNVPSDVDLGRLTSLTAELLADIPASLTEDALWRDLLALTGQVHTFAGRQRVSKIWNTQSRVKRVSNFRVGQAMAMKGMIPGTSWVDVSFTFQTSEPGGLPAVNSGGVSLVPADDSPSGWRIWCLRTMLESLEDHQNPDDPAKLAGAASTSSGAPAINGYDADEYEVLIVGGGQNGLSLAGRLGALAIPYLLIERNEAIGENWSQRYDSMHWHTPTEFSNLPFGRTFDEEDGMWLPAKKIAEGYQRWVRDYNINVWNSASPNRCKYDTTKQMWSSTIECKGKTFHIKSRHLCLALGSGFNEPNIPDWPNQDAFQGTVRHQIGYRNSKAWKGKRGVVVGTGTSAHDVAVDMVDAGLSSVTVVQRKPTPMLPLDFIAPMFTPIYNRQIPTDVADRLSQLNPNKVMNDMTVRGFKAYREQHQDYYTGLERAGFKVDYDTGFVDIAYNKNGHWCVDIEMGKKIIDGSIKIKSGSEIVRYTDNGLAFGDGTELEADFIVLATGHQHDVRKQAATFIGSEADKLSEMWGLDAEGEARGVLKQTELPGLWQLMGGTNQARFWSRFIALQIQAQALGKPLTVYEQ